MIEFPFRSVKTLKRNRSGPLFQAAADPAACRSARKLTERQAAGSNIESTERTLHHLHLKVLTTLEYLDLNDSHVTNAGLVHLKGLTELRMLRVDNTAVTDAGLVHLEGLTKLKILAIGEAQLSDTGEEFLKALLPKCRIYRLLE